MIKTIFVSVSPKSKKSELIKLTDAVYKAFVKSVPDKGKANDELLTLIAHEFKLKPYNVEIKSGQFCKRKVIALQFDEKCQEKV